MNVEQQLLTNQTDMLKALGRLEKGHETINARVGKLEDWKETRPQNCPVKERKKHTWPVIAGVSALTVAVIKGIELGFRHFGGK